MKPFLLVLFMLMAVTGRVSGQNLIAVQNGVNQMFYTKLDSAILHANNGDTIYIPGGTFLYSPNLSPIIIDKELHFIGTGHHPDSTKVTDRTCLYTSITLKDGSSNSSFEGFYLDGEFKVGETGGIAADVDHIKISRCNCAAIYLDKNSSSWEIIENIVHNYVKTNNSENGSLNCFFCNNIFCNYVQFFSYSNFSNNIFLRGFGGGYIDNLYNCDFRSNILWDGVFRNMNSCTFYNNILFNFGYPPGSTGSGNIFPLNQADVFINCPNNNGFNYAYDFHLQLTSPGKNAGKDGTDIGIYGGAFPWKDGSIPFNPHFQRVQIAPKTDNQGNLNVNIKVKAQDH